MLALYTPISAYSSGVGDGSVLFWVLGGVRTGCPLSSVLFMLCLSPFVASFSACLRLARKFYHQFVC